LVRAGSLKRLFGRFDRVRERGYLAMGGQIVDATIIEAWPLLDGDNLASSVWADTAYRSQANLRLLDRRGLVPEFQRRKRAASRCPPTSAGATPLGHGCEPGSSMSSRPRNGG
jgi:hypothetical protein